MSKELIKTEDIVGVVMPAITALEAKRVWRAYEDLKTAVLDKKVDIQVIEGKEFKKKSYWRKIATFFNLSIETLEEKHEQIGKTFAYHFTVKCIAPNGRYVVGTGSCDAYEKCTLRDGIYVKYDKFSKSWKPCQPNSIHNIRATAYTRAFNRAVSDLVGGGEVSAEEVTAQDIEEATEPNIEPFKEELSENVEPSEVPDFKDKLRSKWKKTEITE